MDGPGEASSPQGRDRGRAPRARAERADDVVADLLDRHLAPVHAFVARRIWDRRAAEAVTATTFARVAERIRRGDLHRETASGVLYRTAVAVVATRRRPGVGTGDTGTADGDASEPGWPDTPDGELSAARLLAAGLDRHEVSRALLALPPGPRRLIVLRFLDGLGPDELCAVLECSRATLAIRLRAALRALADGVAGVSDAA
jgi:DNA-directed RNA polymerase specialized sigma24 family protein